jgi:murein DD-endopeptidase MepM/ murein hydrolase activator NlpD
MIERTDNMEEENQKKPNLYKRFLNSKAFYPVMLCLIAALCVSIWAVNSSNKSVTQTTTAVYSQANKVVTDVADERTQTQTVSTAATSTTAEPTTYAYQANQPYKGNYSMPIADGKVIKDYSDGTLVQSKTMGDYRVHNGIDISAKKGAKVIAINSGCVEDVYTDAFWGVVAVVNHGGGITAKYCGLESKSTVSKGTLLEKGQQIGVLSVVPCEQKDDTHLHLEIMVDDEVADPLLVMNKTNSAE